MLLLLFLVPGVLTRPLDPAKRLTQFPMDKWQAEQGLPQSSVRGLSETPDGYIWVATEKGLARFDGVTFTPFDPDNTPGMRSSLIHSLCATPDGTLWFGATGGGLGSMKGGIFRSFGKAEGLPHLSISALCPGSQGDLWVGTYGAGLARFTGGKFERFNSSKGLPGSLIIALCTGSGNDLWVATEGGAVSLLHEGRFTPLPPLPGQSPHGVLSILQDRSGTLWIGTALSGLLRRVPGGSFDVPDWAKVFSSSGVSSILEDRDGALWLGMDTGELKRFNGAKVETLGVKDGMPGSPIRMLYEDPAGNLWVGTQTAGLIRLRNGRFTPISTNEGLSSEYATGVLESRSGGLWVATRGGGLNYVYRDTVRVYRTADGLSSDALWSLLEARDGTLWIGTDGGGLCRLKDGIISKFGADQGFNAGIVISLYQDRHGDVWVGTNGDGLFRVTDGHLDHYGRAQGLPSLVVHAILEDSHGNLWIGTEEGLARLSGGRPAVFTTRQGLPNDLVLALYEDPQGLLWIGTAGGGLGVLQNGSFGTVNKAKGLFDNDVFTILPDDQGNFWISCNGGVFRASRRDLLDVAEGRKSRLDCVAYGRADGMKSAECNGGMTPAGARLKEGRLCFPTIRGIVLIDPAEAVVRRAPPKVLVERITYDGIPMPRSDSLSLPGGVRHFEIHFTGLSSYAPERIRFRYQLEGFDNNWVVAGTNRVAYYTNLKPGRYQFRVTAVDSEGVSSQLDEAVQVVIPPRFYETSLFFGSVVLLLLVLLALAYNFRIRNLRRRQRRLETEVAKRTSELKEANAALGDRTLLLENLNRELERISSEDALTGLANRRHFDDRLDQEWRRAERGQLPLALVSLDVDFFKEYNDAYGHPQGDVCLRELGAYLSGAFGRATDLPARLGGDEFCVILAGTPLEEASELAEKIRCAFENLAIPNRASKVSAVVTLTLGVAAGIPGPGSSADTLLKAADMALYMAKEQGKNRVCAVPLSAASEDETPGQAPTS